MAATIDAASLPVWENVTLKIRRMRPKKCKRLKSNGSGDRVCFPRSILCVADGNQEETMMRIAALLLGLCAVAFIPRGPPNVEAVSIHLSSTSANNNNNNNNPLERAGLDSVIFRRALFRTWCAVNDFEEPEHAALARDVRASDRFVAWSDNLDFVLASNENENVDPPLRMGRLAAFSPREIKDLFPGGDPSPIREVFLRRTLLPTVASKTFPRARLDDTTPRCDACESTVARVDKILKTTNATVHTLAKFAKDVCDAFSTKVVADECVDIADDMGEVASLLAYGASPEAVCRTIGYCVAKDDVAMHNLFQTWMIKHSKVYRTVSEYTERLEVYARNILRAHEHNSSGRHTHRLSVSGPFADLTADEFRKDSRRSGFRAEKRSASKRSKKLLRRPAAPAKVDWRTKGVVAPPGDQGQCGSCYAWSAVEAVQSAHAIKTGKLLELSEQQVIDCDSIDNGCNGGLMDNVFKYIVSNGGIDTSADYTYTAQDGSCNARKANKHAVAISGFQDVKANSPSQLKLAVAQQPVSVAVCAEGDVWQLYDSGVVSTGCCTDLDHGVLAIGFDTAPSDSDAFWLVANSWGSTWGEDGTIRLALNVSDPQGVCGIAMAPSFPIA